MPSPYHKLNRLFLVKASPSSIVWGKNFPLVSGSKRISEADTTANDAYTIEGKNICTDAWK